MNAATLDLANEPGLELLRMMALRESNQEAAFQACEEFYRRFARRILAAAYKFTYIGPDFDPEVHVSETFIRAYRSAHTFKPPEGVAAPEAVDEKILFWLFRILKNLIATCQRSIYSQKAIANMYSKSHVEKKGMNNLVGMGPAVLPEFLKMITPQDKEILTVSFYYYDKLTGECDMPDNIRDNLCSRVGISVGNLRVRRSRLVARLISLAMSKQNPPTPTTL